MNLLSAITGTNVAYFCAAATSPSVLARDEYVGGKFYRNDSGLIEVPSDIPPDATRVYLDNNANHSIEN